MLNKRRRKNAMDPSRIIKYNQFLSTLDQSSRQKFEQTQKLDLNEKYKNLKTEDDIKNQIDKIIETINSNFKINDYS